VTDCRVLFDDLDVAASRRELVALGGVLEPATLRAAYRNGIFPWPPSAESAAAHERAVRKLARRGVVPVLPRTPEGPLVPWVSPHPRAVLLTDRVSVPRSLRQQIRRCGWETTVDAAFAQVVARCADRSDGTWITDAMRSAYTALHSEGGAHSLEVWDGERLVGGLYGVLTGGVFSGESMFFVESGASKVAVVDLCQRLLEAGVRVLDTQQESEHLAAMGQVLVHRQEYVEAVRSLRDQPATIGSERLPVARVLAFGGP
jgi:leucyl/phenylalanyl-tRNA--protein transferase